MGVKIFFVTLGALLLSIGVLMAFPMAHALMMIGFSVLVLSALSFVGSDI